MRAERVTAWVALALVACAAMLTARGASLAAFDGRCIPAACVAPRSNTRGILGRRALPAGRLARLGATPDLHHGLLTHPFRRHRLVELREKRLIPLGTLPVARQ